MIILHMDSSMAGEASISRQLSSQVVDRLTTLQPQAQVIYRDLVANPLAHLTRAILPSSHPIAPPVDSLQGEDLAARAASDEVLQEFLRADAIVIGVPMYNLTIPSQLRAWIDRVIVPGTTLGYSAEGPVGMIKDKRAILAISQGGAYSHPQASHREFVQSYMTSVLNLIGLDEVEVVLAEGLSISPDIRSEAIDAARAKVEALA
ncbi:NAD(P)H-dependent oxidoreductase [Sphingobium sp. LB126]|uniref:FMN-dependent NADH-azoreductase n=1 Tax=Sphingobium sp. LB126 TaxID=1983755 RepID=UPI0018D5623C|nr:NAD(P)H-dependent oxidoreductase [Sphingobium sp. LB126]